MGGSHRFRLPRRETKTLGRGVRVETEDTDTVDGFLSVSSIRPYPSSGRVLEGKGVPGPFYGSLSCIGLNRGDLTRTFYFPG